MDQSSGFAIGRVQKTLAIVKKWWQAHPSLQEAVGFIAVSPEIGAWASPAHSHRSAPGDRRETE